MLGENNSTFCHERSSMRSFRLLACTTLLLIGLSGCGGDGEDTTFKPFNVAVIGDSPYAIAYGDTAQFNANPAFIAAVSADASLTMALHVGDIHSGKEFCTQSFDLAIFNQWKAFTIPLVYVPGDNEWADCHKAKQGGGTYNVATGNIDYVTTDGGSYAGGDPVANLAFIRSTFFRAPGKSLGAVMDVHSQALESDPARPADAQFVENVWFEKNGVLFAAINVPGGSNNGNDIWYGAPTMSDAQKREIGERTAATLRWIDTVFAKATANKDVAMVIQVQPEPVTFPLSTKETRKYESSYEEIDGIVG